MNKLTTAEKQLINNLTMVHDPDVKLGDKIDEIISLTGESGTPVNAVNASMILNVTGVVKDGETVSIGTDKYEFMTDAAQTKTVPTNIAVDISASATKATGTLTMDTQPTPGDTVTIGDKTYIFVPVGTDNAEGEVSIGADLAEAQANLVMAIVGNNSKVHIADFIENAAVITALIGGTIGNSIPTTETFTAGTNVFAATTLLTGADCSAANAITALVVAITAHDTQGVGATDGDGDTVVLTADVAGESANDILLAETLANGAFEGAAINLAGGIDGTVAVGTKFLMDATYLYVCLAGNTVSQKNWRRIQLGSAY